MRQRRREKVGIALAGGGPLGGIYEIGALVALQEALVGAELTDFDVYVGVSSGAFVTAGLANGMSPREMHEMFILDVRRGDPFEPGLLLRPAFSEFARRIAAAPALLGGAALSYFGRGPGHGFVKSLMRLTRGLPNGLFDNAPMAAYLARQFNQPGRTNDFRKLGRRLFIVAADLDSGRAAPFGAPGLDDVPISEAVKASSALPGLYPPARIAGRDYVDGAVKKTLHASVALKEGVKLLLCVNPLVPYDSELAARRAGAGAPAHLADRGLVTVLSQTFRAMIHSRMRVGMERYAAEFPDADVLLFEPASDDPVIFFANMFSYADRRRLAEHAYQHMRAQLRLRADELDFTLGRHGMRLDRAALEDEKRRLPTHAEARRKGGLWDSVNSLHHSLGALELTLSRKRPARAKGDKRHAAKAATTHA